MFMPLSIKYWGLKMITSFVSNYRINIRIITNIMLQLSFILFNSYIVDKSSYCFVHLAYCTLYILKSTENRTSLSVENADFSSRLVHLKS